MKTTVCTLIAGAGLMVAGSGAVASDWETKLNLGMNLQDGNSDTLTLHAGIGAENGDDENHTKLSAEYNYGETDDSRNVDNLQAYAEYRKVINNQTYGLGTASLLTDSIADIDYRAIAGAGVGQYLLRDDTVTLGIEMGLAWVFEDVLESDDYLALRLAQFYDHDITEHARFFESVEYLPEVDDFENYLINGRAGIEADINSHLALRLVVQNRHDSQPAEDNERNDLSLIAGLAYTL